MTAPRKDDSIEDAPRGDAARSRQMGLGTGHPGDRGSGSLRDASPEPCGAHDSTTQASAEIDEPSPWQLARTPPTSVLAILVDAGRPAADDVVQAFARFVGSTVAIVDEGPPADEPVLWTRVVAVPGLATPVVVWAEPHRPSNVAELPDPRLAQGEWMIGCQTVLGSQTPLDDFIALMRLLAGSLPEAEAVLDLTTHQWFVRGELEQAFLRDDALATEDMLWRVRAVSRSEVNGDDDPVWLYTVGLARCGAPELEILELPHRHLATGVALLNGIAALALAAPLPRPGIIAAIGENLRVAFRPWQEVAEFLGPAAVGTSADRRATGEAPNRERGDGDGDDSMPGDAPNPLLGVRAAVCDPEPRGSFRRIWTWPQHAIRQLEAGRGAIYLSDRSTLQLARRARATWPHFAAAFESLVRDPAPATMAAGAPHPPAFLVKAAFSREDAPDRGREHLWFEVRSLSDGWIDAELLNVPHVATQFSQGEVVRIRQDQVSDWRVLLGDDALRPATAEALDEAVRARRA